MPVLRYSALSASRSALLRSSAEKRRGEEERVKTKFSSDLIFDSQCKINLFGSLVLDKQRSNLKQKI